MAGRKILLNKKIWFFAAVFCLLLAGTGAVAVRAFFDKEKEAVHIHSDEIENSTLIIGTHLIHISVFTEELYEVAKKTLEQSGQTDWYYKSELGGGAWYQISDASGLGDIQGTEKKVSNSVINSFYVRYHTKSDGITYDLMDGKAVCLFDTNNPYDLEKMAELGALAEQYDALGNKSSQTDTDKKNQKCIKAFMEKSSDLEKENEELNKTLAALNRLYMKNATDPGQASVLQAAMKQVDCSRRANVAEKLLNEMIPGLLKDVQDVKKQDYLDTDLTNAIAQAMDEVADAQIEYENNALGEGNNALSRANYQMIQALAQAAESGDGEEADLLVNQITDLKNIERGISVNPDREKSLITEVLLPLADGEVKESMDEADLEKGFAQGSFLAKAAADKMSSKEAADFLEERMAVLEQLAQELENPALQAAAKDIMEKSKAELKQAILNTMGNKDNEMSLLLEQKEELQTERLSALDDNQLAEAERLEEEIEQLDERIEKLEQELTEVLLSDTATEAQKAQAQAALGSKTAVSLIAGLKAETMDHLQEKDYDAVEESLSKFPALEETAPKPALSALQDIYKSAAAKRYLSGDTDSKRLDKILEELEELAAEAAANIPREPEKDSLLNAVEAVLERPLSEADNKEQAAAVAALCRFAGEMGSETASELAAEYGTDFFHQGNDLFFEKLQNETSEFIPLDTFAANSFYRYIFHQGNKTAILRNGKEFYEFSAFSSKVKTRAEKEEEMDAYARYQSSLYISSEYMEKTFQSYGVYIKNTGYGILILPEMQESINTLVEELAKTAGL